MWIERMKSFYFGVNFGGRRMNSPLSNLILAKVKEQMFSVRMYLAVPVLALCIVGSV